MKTITIRGIDELLSDKIKIEAKKNSTSINQFVINMLKEGLGLDGSEQFKEYHDLDDLAGSWSEKEYNEFVNNTKQFEIIDEDLWK